MCHALFSSTLPFSGEGAGDHGITPPQPANVGGGGKKDLSWDSLLPPFVFIYRAILNLAWIARVLEKSLPIEKGAEVNFYAACDGCAG